MWLSIAISAQLLYAIVFIIDKILLGKAIPRPSTYALYIGILGIFVLVLTPFGFSLISIKTMMVAFASGASFVLASLVFYEVLRKGEASRVVPVVGAAIPIFALIISKILLNEVLDSKELVAFILLIVGGFVITFKKTKFIFLDFKFLALSFLAGLIFAFSFVLIRYVYISTSFINGFIWARIGGFIFALFFFIFPNVRKSIFTTSEHIKPPSVFLFTSGRVIGAAAFFLLNFAISLKNATLVNSLQGVQYFFLLILAVVLSRKIPQFLREDIIPRVLAQKILGIVFISFGLLLLIF